MAGNLPGGKPQLPAHDALPNRLFHFPCLCVWAEPVKFYRGGISQLLSVTSSASAVGSGGDRGVVNWCFGVILALRPASHGVC